MEISVCFSYCPQRTQLGITVDTFILSDIFRKGNKTREKEDKINMSSGVGRG